MEKDNLNKVLEILRANDEEKKRLEKEALREIKIRISQEETNRKMEEKERIFKETGVVELFKAIRDSGEIIYEKNLEYSTKRIGLFGWSRIFQFKTIDITPAQVFEGTYRYGRRWDDPNRDSSEDNDKKGNPRIYTTILFNHINNEVSGSVDYVDAYLRRDNVLVVEGSKKMVVGENLSMAEAVGIAIKSPKHHEWSIRARANHRH